MRELLFTVITLYATVVCGASHAQGFTSQELDRMSQERLNRGDFRGFAAPPAPPTTTPPVVLRQPQGLWACLGINDDTPILANPAASAPLIGRSGDRIAAGQDEGAYTRVLLREGKIGFVPRSALREYRNQFNPGATCTVQGVRPNGVVQYSVR